MDCQRSAQSLSSPLGMNPHLNSVAILGLYIFSVGDKSHRLTLSHCKKGQVGAECRIARGPMNPFSFTPSWEARPLSKRGCIDRKKIMRSLRRPTEIGNLERNNDVGKC